MCRVLLVLVVSVAVGGGFVFFVGGWCRMCMGEGQVGACGCGFPVFFAVKISEVVASVLGGLLWMVFGLAMAWGTKSYAICF